LQYINIKVFHESSNEMNMQTPIRFSTVLTMWVNREMVRHNEISQEFMRFDKTFEILISGCLPFVAKTSIVEFTPVKIFKIRLLI
jgi:hypothetical protein